LRLPQRATTSVVEIARVSIAPHTTDFRGSAYDGPDDAPLNPELHPKLPVVPSSSTPTPAAAAPNADRVGDVDRAAASTRAAEASKPIPKAVRLAPASYEVFVAQPVREEPAPVAEPVAPTAAAATIASPAPPAIAEPVGPALVGVARAAVQVEAAGVDVDDPLAQRGGLAATGLGAWLWHIRLSLMSSGISGFVHAAAIVVLGTLAYEEFVPPPLPYEPLVVSVPAEKLIDQIKPPVLKAPESKAPEVRSDGRTTGSGTGSAGSNGGRGNGNLGGLAMSPIALDTQLKTAAGGTGFGTDKAYGTDMLGEVGELKKEATFFGVKAEGRSFVFVVDTSGSMAGNNRYLRCRAELLRAVNELGHGQKYFIAFFNHQTFAMPERKLVDAKSPQIKKTSEWIVHAMPAGTTEPWDAFQMALGMRPDAVFLLTDGEFSPDVARRILNAQNHAKKKVPVHTIAFESVAGEAALKAIAEASGGKYLYVP
jgi:hypothetical protein